MQYDWLKLVTLLATANQMLYPESFTLDLYQGLIL